MAKEIKIEVVKENGNSASSSFATVAEAKAFLDEQVPEESSKDEAEKE